MKKAGFTLIESCLVLLIAAMVIAIGIFPQKQTVERYQETIFYEELKNGFSYVAMKASVKGTPGQISFMVDEPQRIVFSCGQMSKSQRIIVKLPETIRFDEPKNVVCGISDKGSLTPATVRFSSGLTKTSYRLTLQLGFGAQYRITPVRSKN